MITVSCQVVQLPSVIWKLWRCFGFMPPLKNVPFLTTHSHFFSHQDGSSVWSPGYSWVHFFLPNFYVNCFHDPSSLQTLTSYLCCTTNCSVTQIMSASNAPGRWSASPSRHCFIIRCIAIILCFSPKPNTSIRSILFHLNEVYTAWPCCLLETLQAFAVSPSAYNEATNRQFNQ